MPSRSWGQALQPGGRAPAPGALALVQSFLNSFYDLERDHGAELLADPPALVAWFAARGLVEPALTARGRELTRALAVRAGLRELARSGGDGLPPGADVLASLNDAATGIGVEIRLDPDGPRFVAAARSGIDGALGVVLAVAAQAMIDGSWRRLKICPGDECGWAFYDHSRNQTGRWCSMTVCGARSKARAHYHRRRGAKWPR